MFPKKITIHIWKYSLKIIRSNRDLDYMTPKGISPQIPNTYLK